MLILNWAIESNNMYIWFQTVTQQNNIARCASTNPLAFYNFSLGTDSVKCKYNDSKADKEAKKLSEKNIYANPFNFKVCWFTAATIYYSLERDKLSKSEKIFKIEKDYMHRNTRQKY